MSEINLTAGPVGLTEQLQLSMIVYASPLKVISQSCCLCRIPRVAVSQRIVYRTDARGAK